MGGGWGRASRIYVLEFLRLAWLPWLGYDSLGFRRQKKESNACPAVGAGGVAVPAANETASAKARQRLTLSRAARFEAAVSKCPPCVPCCRTVLHRGPHARRGWGTRLRVEDMPSQVWLDCNKVAQSRSRGVKESTGLGTARIPSCSAWNTLSAPVGRRRCSPVRSGQE